MNHFCGKKGHKLTVTVYSRTCTNLYINKIVHNFLNSFMKFINLTKYYEE